ncbi:unnamed protein product, partial [Phaeothamnion confervicola]
TSKKSCCVDESTESVSVDRKVATYFASVSKQQLLDAFGGQADSTCVSLKQSNKRDAGSCCIPALACCIMCCRCQCCPKCPSCCGCCKGCCSCSETTAGSWKAATSNEITLAE